jgi:hypothetical protein
VGSKLPVTIAHKGRASFDHGEQRQALKLKSFVAVCYVDSMVCLTLFPGFDVLRCAMV